MRHTISIPSSLSPTVTWLLPGNVWLTIKGAVWPLLTLTLILLLSVPSLPARSSLGPGVGAGGGGGGGLGGGGALNKLHSILYGILYSMTGTSERRKALAWA